MGTTTIRVDTETHAQLLALSQLSGASLIETVRAATKALRRQQFAQTVTEQLEALRGDPGRWNAYIADGEAAVSDGIS
ncbi:MAG: hypothetical protein HKN94_04630 [Acidimicrobiales bacterium]|nr:hypothetical protein [Acidimicrobiales bacterium]